MTTDYFRHGERLYDIEGAHRYTRYTGGGTDPRPDDCWSCDEQPAMDDFGLCASCKVALR